MKKIVTTILLSLSMNGWTALKGETLNTEVSQTIISKAIECGRKNKWSLSVAIVNAEGRLISFQRDDGSYVGSIDASIAKATSSNAFQRPTSAFVEGVKSGRLGMLSVKDVVANEGGIPIVLNGKHVGAIGISGAKSVEDEQCAKFALE